MKFYIASRFGNKEEVRKIIEFLRERGHDVSMDWTVHESIKPFEKNMERAKRYAIEDIDGVRDCDVFILISDEAGTGMYIELGVAIALDKRIFVVGEHTERTIFYFHPKIQRRDSIEDVFRELRIS